MRCGHVSFSCGGARGAYEPRACRLNGEEAAFVRAGGARASVRIRIDHRAMKSPGVFECPVCFEPLQKPVFQRQNGHPMCCACADGIERSHNKACPTCRVALTERIRSLEADRRADKLCRVSPYFPAPRASPPASIVHVCGPVDLSDGLPQTAQLGFRQFDANAFPKARPSHVNTDLDAETPQDALVEIYIFKISDEVLGFGVQHLNSSGATYQIQVRSPDNRLLTGLGNDFYAFPSTRWTSPGDAEDLSEADLVSVAGHACVFLYIADSGNNTVEDAVKWLERFLVNRSRRVCFRIWEGAREPPGAHFYDVPPPSGGG